MKVADVAWPMSRLGEGAEELARRAGLRWASGEAIVVPETVVSGSRADLDHWLGWLGRRLGLEVEPVETTVPELDRLLAGAGPAILAVDAEDGPRFLLLVAARSGTIRLLGPDLRLRSCPSGLVRSWLSAPYEAPLAPSIEKLIEAANIAPRRRRGARSALLRERLAGQRIGGCWMLRLPPSSSFAHQLARQGVPKRLLAMLVLFGALYALEILGWILIGAAAIDGRVDFGWLGAWVLIVASMIPVRLLGRWVRSTLSIDVSGLLKSRLLAGALRLDLDAVRHQGVGQLLGRVVECHSLEALAVNGGLAAIVAIVELGFAAWILAKGAGGTLHLGLLLAWLAVTLALAWRYYRRLGKWTSIRLALTHDLIEQMVGHRTRLAQEWPERRAREEDHAMKEYLDASSRVDGAVMPVLSGVPGGWMLLGLIGVAPAFVAGSGTTTGFAIALGGVLIAGRAFGGIADGLAAAARAALAWNQAGPLFGTPAEPAAAMPFIPRVRPSGPGAARLVEADGVTFSYLPQGEPVLHQLDLSIAHGERILLDGASGGGKSTLASLLAGLRQPQSGLLLLDGMDRPTLGEAWHQIATEAPQFHDNHVFSAPLAFNLLMGRQWPPSEDDIEAAEALCRELGLGDLLDRMPSGMMQMVGETGWQLSHGERSRIFLARALLQGAELTILDESFAALDPETLRTCLDCATKRARTLLVMAHP
jgi:ATP-binding cassette subfamily B protein